MAAEVLHDTHPDSALSLADPEAAKRRAERRSGGKPTTWSRSAALSSPFSSLERACTTSAGPRVQLIGRHATQDKVEELRFQRSCGQVNLLLCAGGLQL